MWGVLLEEEACNVGTAEIHSLASYVSFALSSEWRGKTGLFCTTEHLYSSKWKKKRTKKTGKKMFAIIQWTATAKEYGVLQIVEQKATLTQ